jgi:hypothetical protein
MLALSSSSPKSNARSPPTTAPPTTPRTPPRLPTFTPAYMAAATPAPPTTAPFAAPFPNVFRADASPYAVPFASAAARDLRALRHCGSASAISRTISSGRLVHCLITCDLPLEASTALKAPMDVPAIIGNRMPSSSKTSSKPARNAPYQPPSQVDRRARETAEPALPAKAGRRSLRDAQEGRGPPPRNHSNLRGIWRKPGPAFFLFRATFGPAAGQQYPVRHACGTTRRHHGRRSRVLQIRSDILLCKP